MPFKKYSKQDDKLILDLIKVSKTKAEAFRIAADKLCRTEKAIVQHYGKSLKNKAQNSRPAPITFSTSDATILHMCACLSETDRRKVVRFAASLY